MPLTRLCSIRAAIGLSFFFLVCFAISGPMVRLRAQSARAELTGMWKATVGNGPVIQGMWLAEISKDSPNATSGSWSLLSDAGGGVCEGDWAARKRRRGRGGGA